MNRLLMTAAMLVLSPAFVHAQLGTPLTTASGVGGFGGGVRPGIPIPPLNGPGPSTWNPRFRPGNNTVIGIVPPIYTTPGFPFGGVWSGFGGYYPWYGTGYDPFGFAPVLPAPTPVVTARAINSDPGIVLANQFPAVLTLEFPLPAEVWVNGEKKSGDPQTEWTLTSPVLAAGADYQFQVKARWTNKGQAYEIERTYTVAGGNRSRALIVSGTAVKE